MCNDLGDWSVKYQEVVNNPPKEGDILTALEGDAILIVEVAKNSPPFLYGKAFVPELPDIEPRWYLQNEGYKSPYGWKCILMPRARTELMQKCGLKGAFIKVKSLRVVKPSQTGKSLLCEVYEY
jgi:hypothetical protein